MKEGWDDEFDGLMFISKKVDKLAGMDFTDIAVQIASDFAKDVNKLPSPRSNVVKSGYTHLLDSVQYARGGNEVMVGWGVYYGRMVEFGTTKMQARPHMYPLWNEKKNDYYSKYLRMIEL